MEQVVGLAQITSDGQRPEIRNNLLHGKVTKCPYKLNTLMKLVKSKEKLGERFTKFGDFKIFQLIVCLIRLRTSP